MRVILDTNVFVSGVFFTVPRARILEAWSAGRLSLVISPEILDEYYRVGVRYEHPQKRACDRRGEAG